MSVDAELDIGEMIGIASWYAAYMDGMGCWSGVSGVSVSVSIILFLEDGGAALQCSVLREGDCPELKLSAISPLSN